MEKEIELQSLKHQEIKEEDLPTLVNKLDAWVGDNYGWTTTLAILTWDKQSLIEMALYILQSVDDKINTMTKSKAQELFKEIRTKNTNLRAMTNIVTDSIVKNITAPNNISSDKKYINLYSPVSLPPSSKKYIIDKVFDATYKIEDHIEKDSAPYTHIRLNDTTLCIADLVTDAVQSIEKINGSTIDNLLWAEYPHPNQTINNLPLAIQYHIRCQALNNFYSDKNITTDYLLTGHTDKITSVLLMSSIFQIASCSQDKTVRLWNITTGNCDHVLMHEKAVTNCCYNTEKTSLATATGDILVKLWNINNGISKGVIEFPDNIHYIDWQGEDIMGGNGNDTIYMYNTKKNSVIKGFIFPHEKQSNYTFMEFSKDYRLQQKIKDYSIAVSNNDVLFSITNRKIHLIEKALKKSETNSNELKALAASYTMTTCSELERNRIQQKIQEKQKQLKEQKI